MRKIFLVVAMVTLASFAAQALDIKDDISVSRSVKPDKMTSHTGISYKSKDYAKAATEMERFANLLKACNGSCDYTGYNVYPDYKYDKGARKLIGYTGSMNINCAFKDIKVYEKLMNSVYGITNGKKDYQISTSPVRWVVSKERRDNVLNELKIEAVKSASDLARKYSSATGMQCSVTQINFSGGSMPFNAPERSMSRSLKMASDSISFSAPDSKEQKLSRGASLFFICK